MEKLYCANCGKENTTAGARFCAFCGGSLEQRPLPTGEECALLCAEVKKLYIDYINWSSDYLASRSADRVIGALFTGDRDYKTRPEHEQFVADCESAVGRLCECFTRGGDQSPVLDLLDYVLFDVHSHCGDEAAWMILACEKYYLPFLDRLSAAELEALYARYKAFRKKKMNLPVQDEMLKKMKKLSKKRI